MRSAVVVFPGSNCDRDMAVALGAASGRAAEMVWHKETALPEGLDLVALPGGFSYGDYLRAGAIAARAPIMAAVRRFAERGGLVLGVCNGWQVLIEAGMLPGALMRNLSLRFVCRDVHLAVENRTSPFTAGLGNAGVLRVPVAHHDGAFVAGEALMARLEEEGRIAFRYADAEGRVTEAANPNGSVGNVAGVLSENHRVLGMMPHPERAVDPALGGPEGRADGARLFAGLAAALEGAR